MKTFKKLISSFVAFAFVLSVLTVPVASSANIGLGLGVKADLNANLGVNKDEDKDKSYNNEVRSGLKVRVQSTTTVDQDDENLPKGIQNSAGVEKRIEDGKGLPGGLFMNLLRFFGFAKTDKPDKPNDDQDEEVLSLKIKGVDVSSVSSTTATITWQTNMEASGEIRYATTSDVTATSTSVSSNSLTLTHEFDLTGLESDTTYYFKVISEDEDDNVAESKVLRFKTREADVDAPRIVFVTALDVQDNSATVVWISNRATSGKVWVSTATPVDTSEEPVESNTDLSFFHEFTLTNLDADTEYFYVVSSTDADGHVRVSATNSFTTDN